jgi:hypothetical protein
MNTVKFFKHFEDLSVVATGVTPTPSFSGPRGGLEGEPTDSGVSITKSCSGDL